MSVHRILRAALAAALIVATAGPATAELRPGIFVAPDHGATVRIGPCAEGPLCATLLAGVLAAPAGAILRGRLDGAAGSWIRVADGVPEILACDRPGCPTPRWIPLVLAEPALGHLARITRF